MIRNIVGTLPKSSSIFCQLIDQLIQIIWKPVFQLKGEPDIVRKPWERRRSTLIEDRADRITTTTSERRIWTSGGALDRDASMARAMPPKNARRG
jgi:hypothetical protein